jgi:oligopeptide transport system substrate-binding protein
MSGKRLAPWALLVLAGLALFTACRGKANEPVTYYGWSEFDIPTLDPQIAQDVISIDAIENLFVQLTNYDPETAEIVPEAATDWLISPDGLVYTFTLRTDIPWIKHDAISGETAQAVDDRGRPRFLTAHDFVYGIKRACDPNIGSYYSSVVAPLIAGCSDVLFAEDPKNIPQQSWDAVGVRAPNDETLVIQLEFPASYFLSMTPMWTLGATPQWTIEAHGKDWTEADNIVTNGRFLLHEWVHDVHRTFLRNPLLPHDLRGDGNVERFAVTVVPDVQTGYNLWLDAKVDCSSIPEAQLQSHLQQFPDETDHISDLSVSYISFRLSKPPFDDPRVRRAFSAAFDRETFVNEVLQGYGLPMIHLAPPGIFGAPPINEVGLGFDPEFARQQLAEAGYPDCQDFPPVTLISYSTKGTLTEYARAQWMQNLGCSADQIRLKHLPFSDLLMTTQGEVPDAQAPHMWTMGWAPDYADENNWVGDVLWCRIATRQKRSCNEIDLLIVQARQESDPQRRIELYRQIEELFFGPEGEMPIFPIALRTHRVARHTWLDHSPVPFGGEQWYTWTIDQKTQLSARH